MPPLGSTLLSTRGSAVVAGFVAGGAWEIWQQAGVETPIADIGDLGISIPAQSLDGCELGIVQMGAPQREPETNTKTKLTVSPVVLAPSRGFGMHDIIFTCSSTIKLRGWQ